MIKRIWMQEKYEQLICEHPEAEYMRVILCRRGLAEFKIGSRSKKRGDSLKEKKFGGG